MSPSRGIRGELRLVGMGGLLIALGMLAVAGPGAFLGSADVDFWGTQWFYWLLGRRLLVEEPFAHTDLIFHPWGKDVYLHTGGNVVDAVLALPFRFLAGPVVGYNLFLLAILLGNGLAGAFLGGAMGAGPRGRAGAGILASLCPYVGWELYGGRPTQAILAPAALFLAVWLRPAGERPIRAGLLAGLWMGLTGLTYWFYALFCVVAAALSLPLRWRGPVDPGAELRFLMAAVGVALALALPLAWPMLQALHAGAVPGLLDQAEGHFLPRTVEGWSIGVQALDLRGLQAGFYVADGALLHFVKPVRVISPLLLLAAGLGMGGRPGALRGLLPVLGLGLLAAGPLLAPDLAWPNLVYDALLTAIPPLVRLWWPARAVGILVLLLLPWAARSLDRLPPGGLLLLAGLGLGEAASLGLLPPPTVSAAVPPIYACLADGRGALLELPIHGHPERQLYQAIHGRPRVGGMLEDNPVFAPAAQRTFLAEDPGAAELIALSEGRAVPDAPLELGPLLGLGVTAVVVDRSSLGGDKAGPGARTRAERALIERLGRPAVSDPDTLVFVLAGPPPRCAD